MEIVFTSHAEERVKTRKISKEEVLEALKFPTTVIKKYDLYYYQRIIDQRGMIEVVVDKTEKNIKIITVYWI